MKYEVQFKHLIERIVTCSVEADNEVEAIELARDTENWIDSNEDMAPEQGLETTDYEVVGIVEE